MEDHQPRLFEFRMGDRAPQALVVAEANRAAIELVAAWRSWPNGALALIGPAGSGKSHVAQAWAMDAEATELPSGLPAEEAAARAAQTGGRVWLDGAATEGELTLFRLLEQAKIGRGALLLVAETTPVTWPVLLPDLVTRLAALSVAELGEPDRMLMAVVLRRLCREKFISLGQDAEDFLLENMAFRFAMARAVAEELDALVVKGAKPVGVVLARRALSQAQRAIDEADEA